MVSHVQALIRHCRNVATVTTGMLAPKKTALELGVRCRVTNLDIQLRIPSIYLKELFPEGSPDPSCAVKLLPGTALNGAPNVFEQFILSALVKRVQPQAVLEIGTFRGGTTWHLFENAPSDAVIYTVDLPDDEVPQDVSDISLAANKTRPFLPRSDRVRQLLIDSRKWDGVLDRKVQFAFIDADHTYEGIRNDTEKTLISLDEYGCICWHDSLEDDFRYGTMQYLLELKEKGWNIFRIRSMHEISSLTVWMTDAMLRTLNVPAAHDASFLFRNYVSV